MGSTVVFGNIPSQGFRYGHRRNALKAQAMVVVREVLEGMLAPDLAQTLLFESLDTLVKPPDTPEQWLVFAQGPLHQLVADRVGLVEATEVSVRVQTILGALSQMPPPTRRSADETGRFERREGPTRVLVLAPTARLARMLKAVLGPTIITMSVPNLTSFKDVVRRLAPSIFLIDLTSKMSVQHAKVKRALRQLPEQALVVIWDEGTPEGDALATALSGTGHPVAWVDRREGVEPLLDHIRALYL
jgi:hypothetical protein